jgi:phospholipid/cholesterol/gamma-HCH transport system substrate-binding protein
MINKNVVVGLFMIAGLALLLTGIILVGDQRRAFSKHIDYYTEFNNLEGLTKGSKVQVGGLDAGQILEVKIPAYPSSRFRVTLRIDSKLQGLVRTDSIATIEAQGLVGETFLSIRPGSAQAAEAGPLSTLESKEAVSLAALLDQSSGLLNNVDGTLKDTRVKLDGALDRATVTLANVNDLVVGIKQGRGTAGMLLKDETAADNIRQTISNARDITTNLQHVSTQAETLMADVQSRQFPEQVDETMHSVKSSVDNIADSTRQIQTMVAETTKPDAQGMSAGENIRESLTNVNGATGNLEADTEALKHNFFVRGFFRRRGYYNLSDLAPDKYRKDKTFLKSEDNRIWLSGSDLFQKTSNGVEVLSGAGRMLLVKALAEYGDAIVEQPIVVEGYSDAADVDGQISVSRSRAILLRQFLFTHYQLDMAKVGIVSMRNSPPPGVGRASWDGICLVIVR